MPIALFAAIIGSLSLHAAALFLPDVDLAPPPESPPLTAEIVPPPRPAEEPVAKPAVPPPLATPRRPNRSPVPPPAPAESKSAALTSPVESPAQAVAEPTPSTAPPPVAAEPVTPVLAGSGRIRFAVFRGDRGFEVGRAEHAWEFADGAYRLTTMTETSGLVSLFKSVRVELESQGTLTPRGLRPDRFLTRRNGVETRERADFDWSLGELVLGRDGSRLPLPEGAQDLASFPYQLAYLARLEEGAELRVATGRKFERYHFDSLGEEEVSVPAGVFRTLHLRVQTDSVTELWLARERGWVPVKIRHTDKKGDSYEEQAVELGAP